MISNRFSVNSEKKIALKYILEMPGIKQFICGAGYQEFSCTRYAMHTLAKSTSFTKTYFRQIFLRSEIWGIFWGKVPTSKEIHHKACIFF